MSITSWFLRIDRFGGMHAVRSQDTIKKGGSDSSNSCGIASILMINFKMKKSTMAAGVSAGAAISNTGIPGANVVGNAISQYAIEQAVKEEPEIYKIYTKVTGSIYDGSSYSNATFFPEVLKQIGLPDWECIFVTESQVFSTIKASTDKGYPVIARVGWDNNGGGHFTVVDDVYTAFGGKLCVCDPWDGELRLPDAGPGQPVVYDTSGTVWSFSLGGNRHAYNGSKGKFSGCIVRKKA
jgi:hypothetical protein